MPIYLDHSATARPWPEVIECLSANLEQHYANPASLHHLGMEAEKSLKESKQQIAALLGCSKNELILTSGGSESINMAIKGSLDANPRLGRRIISSLGEHAATSETLAYLRQQDFQTEELPLQPDGKVDMDALAAALRQPAALITLIHVNNESGAVNDVTEIVRLRNQLQPGTLIHLDAVQSLGRQPVHFHQMGVDLLSGSGHKIGSPKGIGWLLVRQGTHVTPLIHGGGQQQGLRAGTENPPLAAAMAIAMRLTCENAGAKIEKVFRLRQQLLSEISAADLTFCCLSPNDAVPHILNLSFPGLRGETLLHALEARDIYVSTGSACSSHRQKTSRVLKAMGVPEKLASCSIRISLAAGNTTEEIHAAAQAIIESCRWLIRGSAKSII